MNLLAQTTAPTAPLFLLNHPLFGVLLILDIVLRGFALYKAARNNSPVWFVALLLVNSVGILPIIYLVFFSKKPYSPTAAMTPTSKQVTKNKRSAPKTKK